MKPDKTNRLINAIILIIVLGLIASASRGQLSPPPDGGYPNFNTAEGTEALSNVNLNADVGGNTAIGDHALSSNTTGGANTAIGVTSMTGNTTGSNNTATGAFALERNNATGNTATGSEALRFNSSGTNNTAIGADALGNNTTANDNTASGVAALLRNTSGSGNTATGAFALANSTIAGQNTATGFDALFNNTTAGTNTATGFEALFSNTTGPVNTATGAYALHSNTTGQSNVATGVDALYHNQTGHDNTADGYLALLNGKGSNNTALGSNAGASLTTGSNNILVGANVLGNAGEANTIRIGKQGTQKNTLIAGIFGTAVTGSTVVVNSTGKLGVATSSARFKEAIRPMEEASEAILKLKPVTFRYKEEIDPDSVPQFGLVAEAVEKVDPNLITRDETGKPVTVRYEAVNAMLLNEFLKEHQTVAELKRLLAEQQVVIDQQQKIAARQQKQIESLTANLQKVSDRVELTSPSPRVVAENY